MCIDLRCRAAVLTGPEMPPLKGGCTCGAIRFRLVAQPFDTGWCHCRICQHVSGSSGMVFTTVALSHFQIERGADRLGAFQSTPFGERQFCRACGAPLTIHVRHQPDEIDVAVGALDDPGAVNPGFHLYVAQAPYWLSLEDGLPRFAALRPATRGLRPGQTDAWAPTAKPALRGRQGESS